MTSAAFTFASISGSTPARDAISMVRPRFVSSSLRILCPSSAVSVSCVPYEESSVSLPAYCIRSSSSASFPAVSFSHTCDEPPPSFPFAELLSSPFEIPLSSPSPEAFSSPSPEPFFSPSPGPDSKAFSAEDPGSLSELLSPPELLSSAAPGGAPSEISRTASVPAACAASAGYGSEKTSSPAQSRDTILFFITHSFLLRFLTAGHTCRLLFYADRLVHIKRTDRDIRALPVCAPAAIPLVFD